MVIHMEEEDKIFNGVYPRLKIPWEKPKEDYWTLLETKIDKQGRQVKIRRITAWSVAASFLLLLSLGVFARFSTTKIVTAYGQHAEVQLPDGSVVSLNAGSEVSYHKWYWAVSRTVEMNGEAFFKVKKGRKFTVVSPNGQTHVMGTSFNVYSRDNVYKVTCITGKVMVEVPTHEKVFLLPQERLTARSNNVDVEKNIDKLKNFHGLTILFHSTLYLCAKF
jgi:transmembrane sensor